MARKREVLTASVAIETLDKLQVITDDVQRSIGLPVHKGIVVDALVRGATPADVLGAILGERASRLVQGPADAQ